MAEAYQGGRNPCFSIHTFWTQKNKRFSIAYQVIEENLNVSDLEMPQDVVVVFVPKALQWINFSKDELASMTWNKADWYNW